VNPPFIPRTKLYDKDGGSHVEVARRLREYGGEYNSAGDSDDENEGSTAQEAEFSTGLQDSSADDSSTNFDQYVTSQGAPFGLLWERMQPWIYDVAVRTFPWHKEWVEQTERLKAQFLAELREEFPGKWTDDHIKLHGSTTIIF
jgi:hypothetical protein